MENTLLNKLKNPLIIELRTYAPDGIGAQKPHQLTQIKRWAFIQPIKVHHKHHFLPKGLRASNFSNALWGEIYEIILRSEGNLHNMEKIFWEDRILRAITPPQCHTVCGYEIFHAVNWKLNNHA